MMISRFWWNVLVLALCACGCASQQPTTVTVKPTVARPPEIITMVPTPTYRPRIAVPEASDVEFSADRKWLAVGTMIRTQPLSGTISVRDCASNRVVKTWKFAGGVRFLAFAPDGRHIAAATGDNKIRVWDWRSGQLQHSSVIQGGEESQGRMPISYAPDGRTLAIGVKKIQLLDTQSWKIRQLSRQKAGDLIDFIGNLQFSPTGKWILTSDGFEGYSGYNLYRFSSGKARHIVDGGTFGVTVFSRDGRLFAGNAGEIQGEKTFIYNINESKIVRRFEADEFTIWDFSPDAKFLAGIGDDYPQGPVEVWNIARGKRVQRFQQTARAVVWLDAKTLLAGDENGVHRLTVK